MLALGALPASAQTPPSSERVSAVDAAFAEFDSRSSGGCALGVVQDGRFVYKRGYGMANLDWGIPITPSTVFYIGSVSKQFTAAAVALLAGDGTISLDDDIRTFFPELPEYDETVTVRHLIHHTSGIGDTYRVMAANGLDYANRFTPEEGLALLAEQELDFPPGESYRYSNGGYLLLSQLIKRASGMSLKSFAAERIFEPLGMLDTHFHDDLGHVVEGRAMSYVRNPTGGYRQSYLSNFVLTGAGGLYTTVEDLLLWDRNFYDARVGSDDLMRLLHTRGVLDSGEVLPYAFALRHGSYRGLATVGHTGSLMGFKADYTRFPDEGFSIITLCNMGHIVPAVLNRRVADLFLADRFTEPPDQ